MSNRKIEKVVLKVNLKTGGGTIEYAGAAFSPPFPEFIAKELKLQRGTLDITYAPLEPTPSPTKADSPSVRRRSG